MFKGKEKKPKFEVGGRVELNTKHALMGATVEKVWTVNPKDYKYTILWDNGNRSVVSERNLKKSKR